MKYYRVKFRLKRNSKWSSGFSGNEVQAACPAVAVQIAREQALKTFKQLQWNIEDMEIESLQDCTQLIADIRKLYAGGSRWTGC